MTTSVVNDPYALPPIEGSSVFSTLPQELTDKILDYLRPVGSLTTYDSLAEKPEIRRSYVEARSNFSNLSRVSKFIYSIATPYLYDTVIIRDQTELFDFFRTLVDRPELRVLVRSFAWLGQLSVTEAAELESTIRREERAASMIADFRASMNWPLDAENARFAERMGQSRRVLGTVLAMISKVKWLFVLHGWLEPPGLRGPSNWASWPGQTRQALFDMMTDGRKEPIADGGLQDVESIVLEAHSHPWPDRTLYNTLAMFLLNSASLRRIEMKRTASFYGMVEILSKVTNMAFVENVKELLLLRAIQPKIIPSIVTVFPKLVSLEVEIGDGSSYEVSVPRHITPDPGMFPVLSLSETLETLSITTSGDIQRAFDRPLEIGSGWLFGNTPAFLTMLSRMTALKDLTTESVWLFGRTDLAKALQLPHLLPPTLVHLRLIDYWGPVTVSSFPRGRLPPPFYPAFPNDWSPPEFYDQVFSRLYENCSDCLPHLRVITFVSPQFQAPHASAIDKIYMQDYTAEFHELLLKFQNLFDKNGVRLSSSTPEVERTRREAKWACIG
ncbi:hypothetical protein QBC46DRAFT_92184 [Diplogelasinospora grovesii]|uniref:F-box domain-containing protein n=1 Tax=Diplogelasinospora grovesii TaxID=303347 RepID=A0AAN6S611_9PEZI|nr:hypothetical protein QBC46DRAFT_92184 [Diplogelasinospora grovesii]